MSDKMEFIKASGVIHISSTRTLTLLERKISNVFLKNAYDNLLTEDEHYIEIEDLLKLLGRSNRSNLSDIKEAIKNMVNTTLAFNCLNKDKTVQWQFSSLLTEAAIDGTRLAYSYPKRLRRSLYSPSIYARLDLVTSKKFKSRNSLALWEYLMEIICSSTGTSVETPWIPVSEYLSKILCIPNKTEMSFKEINRLYVRRPINEINDITTLFIESVELKRENRYVVAIKFKFSNQIKEELSLQDRMIRQYSKIKATKSPTAYENRVRVSLKNGETTMEAIEEFLDKYNAQKQKKEAVVNAQCDEIYDQKELISKWENLTDCEQKKLEHQAIDELKRAGLKNIEKESIANQKLIKEKCLAILESQVV